MIHIDAIWLATEPIDMLSGGQANDTYAQPLLVKACIPGLRGCLLKRCRWLTRVTTLKLCAGTVIVIACSQ
jgi:hypothetical protein